MVIISLIGLNLVIVKRVLNFCREIYIDKNSRARYSYDSIGIVMKVEQ